MKNLLASFSTESLAQELVRRQPLTKPNGFLDLDLYQLRAALGPVLCVDGVLVRKRAGYDWEGLLIRRNAGVYAGKLCVVGGSVALNESLESALARHFKTDLGITAYIAGTWQRPVYVAQYGPVLGDGFMQDPTKHAVALTYAVIAPQPSEGVVFQFGTTEHGGQEAAAVEWHTLKSMPNHTGFGYGHDIAFRAVMGWAEEHA